MKLLGCHIDNFGSFHNCDLTFNDGLNVVMQPNGWGKTTLAAFVKAMLYGFDGKRVRDVTENERLRYMPWQGGTYGGTLDFESSGREYRVTRTFGATRSKDSIRVINLHTSTPARIVPEDSLGEWLFGLDSASFQKSVYVLQNGFGYDGSTASIRNRLNSLINEADDVTEYDKAIKALEGRRKFYKKPGNKGAIAQDTQKIAELASVQARLDERAKELSADQERIDAYSKAIDELDAQIERAERLVDEATGKTKEREALLKVGTQLKQRADEAERAYEDARAKAPKELPGTYAIKRARELSAKATRLAAEERTARESVGALEGKLASFGKAGGGQKSALPTKEQLANAQKALVAISVEEKKLADDVSSPVLDEQFLAANKAVQENPGLLARAGSRAAESNLVAARLAGAKKKEAELAAAEASWAERKENIKKLQSDAAAYESRKGNSKSVEKLRGDARLLRELSTKLRAAQAKASSLEADVAALENALDGSPAGLTADAAQTIAEAAKLSNEANATYAQAKRESDEARVAADAARRNVNQLQAKLDQEHAQAPVETSTQSGSTSPAGPALIALGVVAAVAGIALDMTLALVAAGIVLAALGVLLLMKGKKPAPNPSSSSNTKPSALEKELAQARKAATGAEDADTKASEKAARALEASNAAADTLASVIRQFFPSEDVDPVSAAAQASAYVQRIELAQSQAQRLAEAKEALDYANDEVENTNGLIEDVRSTYAGMPQDTEEVARLLDDKAAEDGASMQAAKKAEDDLRAAVESVTGKRGGDKLGEFLSKIDGYEPSEITKLRTSLQKTYADADACVRALNDMLRAFGQEEVEKDELAIGAERLSRALDSYRTTKERLSQSEARKGQSKEAIESRLKTLEDWARQYDMGNAEPLSEGWFSTAERLIAEKEQLAWQLDEAKKAADRASHELSQAKVALTKALLSCGISDTTEPDASLDWLEGLSANMAKLRDAKDLAAREFEKWRVENAAALKAAVGVMSSGEASRALESYRERRDQCLRNLEQCKEQRAETLRGLEKLLATRQETINLSRKRQKSIANLFTVQKTSEYLDSARRGLDGRYLGDLSSRFDDYANAWLKADSVDAVIDADFGVKLYEGDAAHDVGGYSTGYQDLLDVCFRLALVDTIFQAEPPFLIMDDPFSNLDQAKLAQAFSLLKALGQRHQIIYFTCHPSRTQAAEGSVQAAFVLPEQRAQRELPQARAKREAQERAQAQAKLVASYKVVGAAPGKARITVRDENRKVSSNLATVTFEVEGAVAGKDNSFEAHFIDEKGRTLCERQTIEVVNGQVVPEQVRFSLSTKADSGDTYDLVIHEEGREPNELAARIPFNALVSFSSEDFDF